MLRLKNVATLVIRWTEDVHASLQYLNATPKLTLVAGIGSSEQAFDRRSIAFGNEDPD